MTMKQPALIQRILYTLELSGENVQMHDTPAILYYLKMKKAKMKGRVGTIKVSLE